MHPYEAAFHFRVRRVEDFVKVRTGSLYHAFEQLQRRGLIEPAEVGRDGRRPERTVYRVTDLGRVTAHESVARLLSDPVNEYTSFEAGLVSIGHLSADEASRSLRTRAIQLRGLAAQSTTILDGNETVGLPRRYILELVFNADRRVNEAHWCDRIAEQIERGEIDWTSQVPEELQRKVTYRELPEPALDTHGEQR